MVCPSGLTSSDIQVALSVVKCAFRPGTSGRSGFLAAGVAGVWATRAGATAVASATRKLRASMAIPVKEGRVNKVSPRDGIRQEPAPRGGREEVAVVHDGRDPPSVV